MAESVGGAGPTSLEAAAVPERQTLRHWPWLAMCLVGAVVFGLFGFLAGRALLLHAESATGYVVTAGLTVGLAILLVYTLASLRIRTVLEPIGLIVVTPFTRATVPWSQVARLDVTHSLPGWAVRAWSPEDDVAVVYLCHDTRGRRPQMARTFDSPPAEAPASLRQGFARIERYWQASGGPAGTRSGE